MCVFFLVIIFNYYQCNLREIIMNLSFILYKNRISSRNWQRRESRKRDFESDAFTKMTLLGPPSGMRYPHAHVNAHRTWYTPRAPPPPSISRAHVDYNYPQVITTHTTVFQWALTAVRPLYSAKLVFPFPVEENRRRRSQKEGTEMETEKRKRLPATAGWSSIQRPPLSSLFYLA